MLFYALSKLFFYLRSMVHRWVLTTGERVSISESELCGRKQCVWQRSLLNANVQQRDYLHQLILKKINDYRKYQ